MQMTAKEQTRCLHLICQGHLTLPKDRWRGNTVETLPSVGKIRVVQGIYLHRQIPRTSLLNMFTIILQGLCSLINAVIESIGISSTEYTINVAVLIVCKDKQFAVLICTLFSI